MDFWISEWISGFQIGFLDFTVDFWISQWISGFHSGFLDFWISGFQFGFLPTVYEISFVTDPSGQISAPSVPSCVCANELSFKIYMYFRWSRVHKAVETAVTATVFM